MNYANDKKEIPADQPTREDAFAENFTSAARAMYAADHPNPERAGCFTNEVVRQMAHSANLPDDSIMNHLFDCSECFREYHRALKSAKNPIEAEVKSGWRKIFNLPPLRTAFVGVGLVLLIGLMFLSFRLWRENQSAELVKHIETADEATNFDYSGILPNETGSANNQTAKNDVDGQTEMPEKRATLNSPKPPQKTEIRRQEERDLRNEIASLNLVLSENNILRNTVNSSEKNGGDGKLLLPARKVTLNIKLPNDFSVGRYNLRFIDAFGNVLLEQTTAVKKGGLSIKNLNLKNLENRAGKVCLQKNGEIPDCFDIKITK